MRRAVFLDRDGTINVEKNYLHRIDDWEWIPGAPEAIAKLNKAGYLVIVVTNQAGVARGLYTEKDIKTLHTYVSDELIKYGAKIDAFYYCPHHPEFSKDDNCNCRKPSPGMLITASKENDIDLENSWMIGDKLIDIEAGLAANTRAVLVMTGYGVNEKHDKPKTIPIAENILQAVNVIISEGRCILRDKE